MSRRKIDITKKNAFDQHFDNTIINKIINYMMKNGKKYKTQKIVYTSIENLSKKTGMKHVKIFEEVICNIKPLVEIKTKRIGGATYQVPVKIKSSRSVSFALKWIINAAKKRLDVRRMENKLYLELLDAFLKRGYAFRKKEEICKIAEVNKVFSHYK